MNADDNGSGAKIAPGFLTKSALKGAFESRNGRLTCPAGVQFDRFESFLLRWIRVRFHAVQHQAGHGLDLEREPDRLDMPNYRFTVRKFRLSIFPRQEINDFCHAMRSPCLHVMHLLLFDPITNRPRNQVHEGGLKVRG
jgi:hypothetical protein